MFTHIIDKENSIGINLPSEKKNILFALSGGADSAILFYLLCKINKEMGNLHSIIPFTVPRGDGGHIRSSLIVNWVNWKLNTTIIRPIVRGDQSLHHSVVVKTVIKELLSTCAFDILFVAENKVHDETLTGAPIRQPTNVFRTAQLPFWHVTKDKTIELFFKEEVTDLLKLTHSCTEQSEGQCGQCYQCRERAWAFATLKRDDPK